MEVSNELLKIISQEPENIKQAKDYYIQCNVLINGVGLPEYLKKLELHENEDQFKLRKKLATSTRHCFARILNFKNKIYSARGGYRQLPSEKIKAFVDDGLYKWMENNYLRYQDSDPNGLVFQEWTNKPIITYKPITSIRNYSINKKQVKWVLFEPIEYTINEEVVKIYRLVTPDYDYTFKFKDEKFIEITEDIEADNYQVIKATVPNIYGVVPAFVIGDQKHEVFDYYISSIWYAVELANEYLIEKSIHNIYKKLHGFPLYWRYTEDCPTCNGTGRVTTPHDEVVKCLDCVGLGVSLKKDISDMIGIRTPQGDEPIIAPNIAGYISPDVAAWREMREELNWLFDAMHFAVLGTKTRDEFNNETATGRFIDQQPVIDLLHVYSDSNEKALNLSIDYLELFYSQKDENYVTLGRRFLIESVDAVWKNYTEAKEVGVNIFDMDHKLDVYHQTEFQSDPARYEQARKFTAIEPLPHMTIEQLSGIEIMKKLTIKKAIYSEWYYSLSENEKMKTEDKLKSSFEAYYELKKDNYEQWIETSKSE